MEVGDRIDDVRLEKADGEEVSLSRYLDRVLLVQLLRYYG